MSSGSPTGAASSSEDAAPVCPRHPRTVSYVRCQRCERPVCPACQRPAAVGVQCVDCVRDQARTVRTARTVFGGRVGTGRPVVTQVVIGICVVVQLLQWTSPPLTGRLSFVPFLATSEPYRFLTAAFLHSPALFLHVLLNMYVLWTLGPYLERLLGAVRFAALYLVSALGGSVGYFLLAIPAFEGTAWTRQAVGASGAVFGLFGAVLVLNRRLERDSSWIVGSLVINLVLGFWPGLNIAWQAHLGGLVAGALVALAIAAPAAGGSGAADPKRRAWRQALGTTGVLALLAALTAVKIATVPPGMLV